MMRSLISNWSWSNKEDVGKPSEDVVKPLEDVSKLSESVIKSSVGMILREIMLRKFGEAFRQ